MTDDEIVDAVAREMSRRKGFGEFGAMVEDVLIALRDAGLAVVPVEPAYQGLASKLWEATKTDWQATIKHVLTEPTCPTVVLVPEDPSYPTVRAGADDIDEAVRLACERALAMISAAQEGAAGECRFCGGTLSDETDEAGNRYCIKCRMWQKSEQEGGKDG